MRSLASKHGSFISKSNFLSALTNPLKGRSALICDSSSDKIQFQSVFVNQHTPLLKYDFRETISESNPKSMYRDQDSFILKGGNSFFDFLQNVLNESFIVGSKEELELERYN